MGRKSRKQRKISPPTTADDLAEEADGKIMRFTQRDTLALMLETAILIWFNEDEPLSIHLIGSAVYRCLDDLSEHIGILRSEVGHEQFTLVYDYLRHAWPNRDVDLVFPRTVNRWLLFESIGSFEK